MPCTSWRCPATHHTGGDRSFLARPHKWYIKMLLSAPKFKLSTAAVTAPFVRGQTPATLSMHVTDCHTYLRHVAVAMTTTDTHANASPAPPAPYFACPDCNSCVKTCMYHATHAHILPQWCMHTTKLLLSYLAVTQNSAELPSASSSRPHEGLHQVCGSVALGISACQQHLPRTILQDVVRQCDGGPRQLKQPRQRERYGWDPAGGQAHVMQGRPAVEQCHHAKAKEAMPKKQGLRRNTTRFPSALWLSYSAKKPDERERRGSKPL